MGRNLGSNPRLTNSSSSSPAHAAAADAVHGQLGDIMRALHKNCQIAEVFSLHRNQLTRPAFTQAVLHCPSMSLASSFVAQHLQILGTQVTGSSLTVQQTCCKK